MLSVHSFDAVMEEALAQEGSQKWRSPLFFN